MGKTTFFDEKAIIVALRSDDVDRVNRATTAFYHQFWPEMSSFMRKKGVVPFEIEDLYQDAIIIVYHQLRKPNFTLTVKLKQYLYAVVWKLSLQSFRRNERRSVEEPVPSEVPLEDTITEDVIRYQREEKLRLNIARLGEKCQEILKLYYFHGYRMREIAIYMKYANEQVAKNKKSKCMKALRNLFSEEVKNNP